MDKTKKNDDNAISPIVKWKILILFMAGLGVIFLFAALAQERHTLPAKNKKRGRSLHGICSGRNEFVVLQ